METLTALGLASNIIQIVDFTSRLISNSREIYHSADGTLEAHRTLLQAAENLSELSENLQRMTAPRTHLNRSRPNPRDPNFSIAEDQLLLLTAETRTLAQSVDSAVKKAAAQSNYRAWRSIRQAVRAMWTQREFSAFEEKLDMIRRKIDTVALVSIREHLPTSVDSPAAELYAPQTLFNSGFSTQRRERELFDAILNRRVVPDHEENFADLSVKLHAIAEVGAKTRFGRMIKARLRFTDMPDGFDNIPSAHDGTFEWVFDEHADRSEDRPLDSLSTWLSSASSNLYWITGKPGSGKSTLMKYVYQDGRTLSQLQKWAGDTAIIRAGFFFWNSGTGLQTSIPGLLATLLHESIEQLLALDAGADSLDAIFPDRWNQFEAFGGGREELRWSELQRAFDRMISNENVRFFFILDGLDKFEGKPKELVDFILTVAERENIKICTASRPWLPFEDAFSGTEHLSLEDLNRQDIANYISDKFQANRRFGQLERRASRNAQALIDNVLNKAEGVFLWVNLVVESLLEGISNADRMSDLQLRLDALPADLEALFSTLINQIGTGYFKDACELFRLIRCHAQDSEYTPTLWELAWAAAEDTESAVEADLPEADSEDEVDILEDMRRLVKSRCMGLLEIRYPKPFSSRDMNHVESRRALKVNFFHRTARDYLYSQRIWSMIMNATKDNSFDPNERWANGFLSCLKTARMRYLDQEVRSWFTWSLEYALRLEQFDGEVRLDYLDEVVRAVANRGFHVDPHGGFIFDISRRTPSQSLEQAFALGLQSYLRIKTRTMTRAEISALHAKTERVTLQSNEVPDYLCGRRCLVKAIRTNEAPRRTSRPSLFRMLPGSRRRLDPSRWL